MSGFGDETAAVTGKRALQQRAGVDRLKLDTAQLLRRIDQLGGAATLNQFTRDRRGRLYARRCLMLAAREGLVVSPGGDRFALTQKARDAIASSERGKPEAAA